MAIMKISYHWLGNCSTENEGLTVIVCLVASQILKYVSIVIT